MDNHQDRSQRKSAGEEVIIGGLRCSVCGTLFRPSETTRNELCRACHWQLAFRERYAKTDTRFNRSPRAVR